MPHITIRKKPDRRKPSKPGHKHPNGALFIRGLDKDIRDDFKAWCARRSLSMTEVIEQVIEQLIRTEKGIRHDVD